MVEVLDKEKMSEPTSYVIVLKRYTVNLADNTHEWRLSRSWNSSNLRAAVDQSQHTTHMIDERKK
jgi:hypothetical protein